jgi:hypothetical protein
MRQPLGKQVCEVTNEFVLIVKVMSNAAHFTPVLKYRFGSQHESEWKEGAPWQLKAPDGRLTDKRQSSRGRSSAAAGGVMAPRAVPRDERGGIWARDIRTRELEQQGEAVKLTVTHEIDKKDSKLIKGVSGGWPIILASLKSLLETGESIERTRKFPAGL